jgi:hypothetical protein
MLRTDSGCGPVPLRAPGARVALGIALTALVSALVAPSPPAVAGLSAKAKPSRVVVSPRPGERVRGNTLTIRVRARDGVGDLRARLNRRRIGGDFGAAQRGVRALEVSVSHGLRHGRNVLRVRVRRRHGTWVRRTVRFVVSHQRALAGAGRDARVVVGTRHRLRGLLAGAAAQSAARPTVRTSWRLVRAPRLSGLGKRRRGPRARRVPALSDPAARRPTFKPDVHGRYTLRLTARGRSGSSSDTVTVTVVPPAPLVSIETMAHVGLGYAIPRGIEVGTKCSTDDKKGILSVDSGCQYLTTFLRDDWLQVVVLDRATLGFVSNKTYKCSSYPFNCGSQVASDLKKLDDTNLVIAVSQPGFTHPYDLEAALGSIGFPKLSAEQEFALLNAPGGVVSVIGVPGLRAGQAHARFVLDGDETDVGYGGDMIGYLTPDQYFNYTYLPKERVPFDTRATTGDPPTVQIGNQTYTSKSPPQDRGRGFFVQILDRHTLAPQSGGIYDGTFNTGCPASTPPERCPTGDEFHKMGSMTALLKSIQPGDIVVITDMGRPPAIPALATKFIGGFEAEERAALRDLASAVASVGGTRHTFNVAGASKDSHYSLIGWGGAGEGNGQETSTQKDPSPGVARIRGTLARDRLSEFKPVTASPVGDPSEALAQLMLQPATPWPLDGDTGAQKAIAYIGSQDGRLGANPRAAYWTQPFDQATWDQIAGVVKGLKYPGADEGFTAAEFAAAKDELVQEITWVGDVRAYLKNLSSPFADNGISSWANLTTITDKVKDALKPPDQRIQMLVLDIIGGVLSIAGVKGGPVVEFVAVAYETTMEYLTQDRDGGDAETITGNANELAAGLVTRLQDAQLGFRNLGNIIVSDYDKLKKVGTLGGCSSTSANCPPEWQFSQRDQQQASVAAYQSIESEFSQELMGLAFPAYTLNPRGNHRAPNGQESNNAKDFQCFGRGVLPAFYPFRNEPDNGQVALLQEPPDRYDVLALGNLSNLSIVPFNLDPNMPPRAVLDRMFGPLDKTLDPRAGGLGINKADFMISANRGDYDNATKEKLGNPVGCGTGNWPG